MKLTYRKHVKPALIAYVVVLAGCMILSACSNKNEVKQRDVLVPDSNLSSSKDSTDREYYLWETGEDSTQKSIYDNKNTSVSFSKQKGLKYLIVITASLAMLFFYLSYKSKK